MMASNLSRRIVWLAALVVTFAAARLPAQDAHDGLRAGAAVVDITPQKLPIGVSGSFQRREATGVHDRLHARAIVLDDGETRVAIVVCDCLLLKAEVFDAAKAAAFKATGIPAEHMLMAATHTHSGPVTVPLGTLRPDSDYLDYLKRQLAKAVVEANARLEPAQVGRAAGREADEVHNRRWYVKPEAMLANPFGRTDDLVRTNPPRGGDVLLRPAGPVDLEVSLLSIRTRDGKPLAVLANYSLHYVGNIPAGQLSADYFGEFARQIATRLKADDRFVGMLSNGTSGDINNIAFRMAGKREPPFVRIREVAGRIADVALQSLASTEHRDQVTILVRRRMLKLGVRRPNDEELQRAKQLLEAAADPENLTRDEIYAFETVQLAAWPETVDVPVQVIRVGNLGIVALPCEAFAEIGLEIKRHSPLAGTFVIGLANDYHGYVPTPAQHTLGGYETWRSRWSYLEREAATKITLAAVGMLHDLPERSTGDDPPAPHALYFVVPKHERTFGETVRQQLGIQGPLKTHWPQRNRFRFKHGYLAWLSLWQAAEIAEHPEVAEVLPYLPDDVVEGARPRGIERNYLDVELTPNSWEAEVDPRTYESAESLAAAWAKRFQDDASVGVNLDKKTGIIRVTISGVKPDPEIAAFVKASGQVQLMRWSQDPPAE